MTATKDHKTVGGRKEEQAQHEHHAQELQPVVENFLKQEDIDESKLRDVSRKSIERYQIGEVLGEGAFSVVYSAFDSVTKETVAIKAIKKYQLDEKQRNNVLKEVNLMKQLNHPNIVKLIDFVENEHCYYIIQEIVKGGEIFNEIVKYTYFSEDLARHVIVQVAEALVYMHEHVGIVHRDLKPENIFFKPIKVFKDDPKNRLKKLRKSDNPNTKLDEGKFIMNYGGGGIGLIKIGDFGLSKKISLNNTDALKTPCGTIGYTAPEIVRDMKYSKEVDMWALGCILYILLCGFPPFFNDSIDELTRTVARGEFKFLSPWWDEISVGAKQCVSRLLTVNPLQRYTVLQFLQDPWILEFLNRSENMVQNKASAPAPTSASAPAPAPAPVPAPAHAAPKDEVPHKNVERQSSGMPGFDLSNAPAAKLPLASVYSQSLMNIANAKQKTEDIDMDAEDSDTSSESDYDTCSARGESVCDLEMNERDPAVVSPFGAQLTRYNHHDDHGTDPIPILEHILEPGPVQNDDNGRETRNANGTTKKNNRRDKNKGRFTPEVMAMKDMYDISIAAHRMHEEGKYTPGTCDPVNNFDHIAEEQEDSDGVIHGGVDVEPIKAVEAAPVFSLNMNDASILARRKKNVVIV